jgi:anthranilate synthase component 2/para-aminobenzoate synthetase component 2
MVLLIDNYDSFVFNLARYVSELGYKKTVVRNDKICLAEVECLNPSHIIISPGPCSPDQAGISLALIEQFSGKIPILGVCLGHQAIGQVFGGKVCKAQKPLHGKTSLIHHDEFAIFKGIKNPFLATRYHSLIVANDCFSKDLIVTATSEEGEIMGIRHRDHLTFGVQFHPEAILTECGYDLLRNFLSINDGLNIPK